MAVKRLHQVPGEPHVTTQLGAFPVNLFEPYRLPVSGVTLPNRLALAPMTTYSSQEDGTIIDAEVEYLRRRAAGGLGTIITAACYVERVGQGFVGQWACDDDRHLPSLGHAAEARRWATLVSPTSGRSNTTRRSATLAEPTVQLEPHVRGLPLHQSTDGFQRANRGIQDNLFGGERWL